MKNKKRVWFLLSKISVFNNSVTVLVIDDTEKQEGNGNKVALHNKQVCRLNESNVVPTLQG